MPAGRPKEYTPESLLEKAHEYMNWCDQNPVMSNHVSAGKIVQVPHNKPYLETGFVLFANIDYQTWLNYKSKRPEYKEFFEVTREILHFFKTQNVERAVCGEYKENIVSRLLGLSESTETKLSGEVSKSKKIEIVNGSKKLKAKYNKKGK